MGNGLNQGKLELLTRLVASGVDALRTPAIRPPATGDYRTRDVDGGASGPELSVSVELPTFELPLHASAPTVEKAANDGPHALAAHVVARIAEAAMEQQQYARLLDQARNRVERTLASGSSGRKLLTLAFAPVDVERSLKAAPPRLIATISDLDETFRVCEACFVADDASALVASIRQTKPSFDARRLALARLSKSESQA